MGLLSFAIIGIDETEKRKSARKIGREYIITNLDTYYILRQLHLWLKAILVLNQGNYHTSRSLHSGRGEPNYPMIRGFLDRT